MTDNSNSWDHHASDYATMAGHGRLSPSEHAAWTGLLRRLIDPDLPRRVLDVGTGFLALPLAELGHEVIGIDSSEAMLTKARAKAGAAGLTIEFRAGDAVETGLPEASVDVVVSRHVLWLLPEPERAVSAWARIARPGGEIIDIDPISAPIAPLDRPAVLLSQALEFARTGRWSRHAHSESSTCEHAASAHPRAKAASRWPIHGTPAVGPLKIARWRAFPVDSGLAPARPR
ncbi:MAG: class I SAM-dependent methyltransferase [Egibacteraceae bacterium]